MKFLPRIRGNYTGSYLNKRRQRKLILISSIAIFCVLVLVAVFQVQNQKKVSITQAIQRSSKQEILQHWASKNWDFVLSGCISSLIADPLDAFFLTFRGFAAYYKAVELPDSDDRKSLLDESCASLRKALVAGDASMMPMAQAAYVLGKAYFQRGKSYSDEAAKYLELSIKSGYVGSDTYEYLALAYVNLGDKVSAIKFFETALATKRSALLLIAAAKAYKDNDDAIKSEALLKEAIEKSNDALATEQARFILGEIFSASGDGHSAQTQYELILNKNPDSAEAHYRIGMLFSLQGDSTRARAEWRKAIAIDPMHLASRQRLSEKQ